MKIETMEDEEIILCALEYAINRQSYITHTVQQFLLKHYTELSGKIQWLVLRIIAREIDNGNAGHKTIDTPAWKDCLQGLYHLSGWEIKSGFQEECYRKGVDISYMKL